jgi:hypothetical protein
VRPIFFHFILCVLILAALKYDVSLGENNILFFPLLFKSLHVVLVDQ